MEKLEQMQQALNKNVIIQKIEAALNENKKINDLAIKENLFQMAQLIYLRFPDISLENLCSRLKNLGIVSGSKFAYPTFMEYVPSQNEIVINKEVLNEPDIEVEPAMMRCVLAMVTSTNINYGFGNNKDLESLNRGCCEILVNNLIGNEGKHEFEDEERLFNLIFSEADTNIIFPAFFKNDPEAVMKLLLSKCGNPEKLQSFLSMANHNLQTRLQTKKSEMLQLQELAQQMFDVDELYLIVDPKGNKKIAQELEWRRSGR